MNLLGALKSRAGTVVLVDNEFAIPKVTVPVTEDRSDFSRLMLRDPDARARITAMLGISPEASAQKIVEVVDDQIPSLWDRFVETPDSYPDLGVLFLSTKARIDGDRQKLDQVVEFCRSNLGVEPVIHHDLASAVDALKGCMIAFIDLYLTAGIDNYKGALSEHIQHSSAYKALFSHNAENWPKVIFLVSSKLPEREQLQEFRDATGIRSAFFEAMNKGDVSLESLQEIVEPWGTKYGPSAKLGRYLDSLSSRLDEAASALKNELSRLELNDLRTLEVLRLSAEGESLRTYLTWLISQSLASKLCVEMSRQSSDLPDASEMPPLDGKLLPKSILFELFADIAVSTSSADDETLEFGDIFAERTEEKKENMPIVLAISPACDLVRCPLDYQVLCVRGTVTKQDPNLSQLLTKDALFGKGNQVVRYPDNTYAHISWSLKKGLITIPASELQKKERFSKIARLSENFTQEIKELALADASRVGTPVEPTFAVEGGVVVRARFHMGRDEQPLERTDELQGKPFISAILTKGRVKTETGNGRKLKEDQGETIVFTHQFVTWLKKDFLRQLKGGRVAPAKLEAIEKKLQELTNWHVILDGGRKARDGESLTFQTLGKDEQMPTMRGDGIEILVRAM
ncbi:MAG: hypothetical protein V4709_12625 [Pseudomonadota bacterium]